MTVIRDHELGVGNTTCIDYCAGQILAREEEMELKLLKSVQIRKRHKHKSGGPKRLVSSYVRIGRAAKTRPAYNLSIEINK